MPNGKPGDNPYTDIIVHGIDSYSPNVARLVREISKLGDEATCNKLADTLFLEYNEFASPNISKLERYLTNLRDKLLRDARARL